eukprot:3863594-Prorocentrum_lima.AAC.1
MLFVTTDSDLAHYVVADVDVGCPSWQHIVVACHVVHVMTAPAKEDPVAGPHDCPSYDYHSPSR